MNSGINKVEGLKEHIKELEEQKKKYFREYQDELSKRLKYEHAFKALVEEIKK